MSHAGAAWLKRPTRPEAPVNLSKGGRKAKASTAKQGKKSHKRGHNSSYDHVDTKWLTVLPKFHQVAVRHPEEYETTIAVGLLRKKPGEQHGCECYVMLDKVILEADLPNFEVLAGEGDMLAIADCANQSAVPVVTIARTKSWDQFTLPLKNTKSACFLIAVVNCLRGAYPELHNPLMAVGRELQAGDAAWP